MDPQSPNHLAEIGKILQTAKDRAATWLDPGVTPPTAERMKDVLAQFYFINRAFVLGVIQYSGRVAAAVTANGGHGTGMERSELEEVLALVVKISADECQAQGIHARRHLHHNLLMRMGPKAGVNTADLESGKILRTSATGNLESLLYNQFRDEDLLVGLSSVAAVEALALPMLTSLRHFVGEFVPPGGQPGFDPYELEHLDLHLELEIAHADESSSLFDVVVLDAARLQVLDRVAQRTVNGFSAFWQQFRGDGSSTPRE